MKGKGLPENTMTAYRGRGGIDLGKGKAIPLQTWAGPEGSRSLKLPNLKITYHTGHLHPQEVFLCDTV
jgi:hypothetical protein